MTRSDLSIHAPTRFAELDGFSLAYRDFGNDAGVPVICLQHFTGTMNNWDPIHTDRLARDRRVILVDYQGVGRSGGQTPESIPDMAADIIRFIGKLGLQKVDIFGFSIGGMVAQQIALDAPDLVRRLLLVGTGPSGGEGMQEFSDVVKGILARPNSTSAERQLDLFFAPSDASQAGGSAWQARLALRDLDREPASLPQVAQAQLAALAKWGVIPRRRYGDLARITQPSLVVNGKDDIMVPTVNSYILQQHLPDARLLLYPDSGHGAHFQYAQHFAETAAAFLAE